MELLTEDKFASLYLKLKKPERLQWLLKHGMHPMITSEDEDLSRDEDFVESFQSDDKA